MQPDILVVPAGSLPPRGTTVERVLLAVGVISPSSARHDRVRKRPHYQRVGVPEYWIVDDQARLVERWQPGDERPEILAASLRWEPEGASEPFVLDLKGYFAESLVDGASG